MTPSKRGDIVLTPFPYTDEKRTKTRPALVVSSDDYNRRSPDIIVAQITSQLTVRPKPGDYRLRQWSEAGLNVPSLVRARLTSVHSKWVIRTIGTMPKDEMTQIDNRLRTALGL